MFHSRLRGLVAGAAAALALGATARAGDFDGRRALRDLADLVHAEAGARAALISERLRQAGFQVRRDAPEPGVLRSTRSVTARAPVAATAERVSSAASASWL